jgi:tetratricopeptide (TPR) repeat protein
MTGRNRYLTAAALALCIAGPAPILAPFHAVAATIDHDEQFKACVALAERAPADALGSAKTWGERGGGDRARLCQALALFHKGDFKEAGIELEELAPALGASDPKVEASLLQRAGWAWMRADDPTQAERLFSTALSKQPDTVDLLVDRAVARGEAERYWDALADLDAAIAKAPQRADAYYYRAGAHKALANLPQALADVGRSLALRPDDPDTLLLRGNIRLQGGGLAGARADWERTVQVAPDTSAAQTARRNLQRLGAAEKGGTEKGKAK